MKQNPIVYVALPAMDEFSVIKKTLDCIRKQTYRKYHLFVCVNQPEVYHHAPAYAEVIESNRKTLEMLSSIDDILINIIDRSSPGLGWDDKNYGVGWARKVLIDEILKIAHDDDIIVSLDADTRFNEKYFEIIVHKFSSFQNATALSNPYYHPLTTDRELNRLMLRYEIYMRYYALNLWRIHSPYCFTALGSAISFPVGAYRKVSGVAPKFSGEDFYLLQKLRKSGRVIHLNEESVYPATRYSSRVFFGTGPALIKGRTGDWTSYPFYKPELFDMISSLYQDFHVLYEKNIPTAADEFIRVSFGQDPGNLWDELRQNNPDKLRFVHSCHIKFDGLRILQFLRFFHYREKVSEPGPDFFFNYLIQYHSEAGLPPDEFKEINFNKSTVKKLNELRDTLYQIELILRKKDEMENTEHLSPKNIARWKYLG